MGWKIFRRLSILSARSFAQRNKFLRVSPYIPTHYTNYHRLHCTVFEMENDLTPEQKSALRKELKAQKRAEKEARKKGAASKVTKNTPAKGQGNRSKDIRLKTVFENKTP